MNVAEPNPTRTLPRRLNSIVLLLALVAVIASAFIRVEPRTVENVVAGILYVAVFSVAGYLIGAQKRWLVAYLAVAAPAFCTGVVNASLSPPNPTLGAVTDLLGLTLQVLLVCLVFRFSLFARGVSHLDRIVAGISGYLILGLMWANIYSLHEIVAPGGFIDSSGNPVDGSGGGFLYFSLITLSTTGYGDLLATAPTTRLLASLEALAGTLYLAVFISTLIGRSGAGNK